MSARQASLLGAVQPHAPLKLALEVQEPKNRCGPGYSEVGPASEVRNELLFALLRQYGDQIRSIGRDK